MAELFSRKAPSPARVHLRFAGRRTDTTPSGRPRQYWVQDLEPDQHDEVCAWLRKGFLREEPICKYSDMNDAEREELIAIWAVYLRLNCALACYACVDEDADDAANNNAWTPPPAGRRRLAGFNVTIVCRRDDPPDDLAALVHDKNRRLFEFIAHMSKTPRGALDHYGVDAYLSAMGLYVLPDFHGDGVGGKILEARESLLADLGLQVTCTVFTSCISQKLAARCGYEDLYEEHYDRLRALNPRFDFPGITAHTQTCKTQARRYAPKE